MCAGSSVCAYMEELLYEPQFLNELRVNEVKLHGYHSGVSLIRNVAVKIKQINHVGCFLDMALGRGLKFRKHVLVGALEQ